MPDILKMPASAESQSVVDTIHNTQKEILESSIEQLRATNEFAKMAKTGQDLAQIEVRLRLANID